MRVLILGADGYLGWPTAMYFANRGYEVMAADNFCKRRLELELGVTPLLPVSTLHHRIKTFERLTGKKIHLRVGDLLNHRFVYNLFDSFEPDAVIHYGEQPSAPYSMFDRNTAYFTHENNVLGNLNVLFAIKHFKQKKNVHLVKLGTMGEYGTPNIDIEEGYIEINYNGRKDVLPFPKQPGSFYHLTKVHDSHNIMFATKIWNLISTDLNQGVVYGIDTNETKLHPDLATSFHYDEIFGTVLNRFCTEAVIGRPLTVYGKGNQCRGFLNIEDTLQCVELAVNNPPEPGRMRVLNQFTETFTINQLAETVKRCAAEVGYNVNVEHQENPRIELEDHYYNPIHTKLLDLGLKPKLLADELIDSMLGTISQHRDLINPDIFALGVKWAVDDGKKIGKSGSVGAGKGTMTDASDSLGML